jgi:hypothetical protein
LGDALIRMEGFGPIKHPVIIEYIMSRARREELGLEADDGRHLLGCRWHSRMVSDFRRL